MNNDAELDHRIDAFWFWFERNSTNLRTSAGIEQTESDPEALNAVASAIYEGIAEISPDLFVELHAAPEELTLVVRSESGDQRLVDRILRSAPQCAGWILTDEVPRDLESVLTRDRFGREIVVRYADLRFLIMQRPSDGRHVVMLVLNGDFDPDGPERDLYDGVAQHVTMTLLGRTASSRCLCAIVPARMATGVATRPILELPDAWSEAVSQV